MPHLLSELIQKPMQMTPFDYFHCIWLIYYVLTPEIEIVGDM